MRKLSEATIVPLEAPAGAVPLRLRFDKVAMRLMDQLRVAVDSVAPAGKTVLLTVSAPIRLPGKTAAALEDTIEYLLRQTEGPDYEGSIHGNSVRIRVLHGNRCYPKFLGFVHNAESDAGALMDLTAGLLKAVDGEAGDDQWLIIIAKGDSGLLQTCREIFTHGGMTSNFGTIFMVFADRRAGLLACRK